SVRGITGLLLELAEDVLTTYADEQLSCLEIVSSRFQGVGATPPTTTRLLPLQATNAEAGPRVRYVGAEHFGSAVIREFLYVTLFDLLLDALAAEHGARLAATEAAESWLEERSDRLRRHLMATRREASTQEMIEIVSGARARDRARARAGTR
ncbi:MAG: F0F1 ATP synthase subunit gamma, partial [Myxococcales bacterium]|nr:F0F1 ATP synthase subunit gamma [Myxococcales bacterium]